MKKLIAICFLIIPFSLLGQNQKNVNYFYNKVLDLIILNDGTLLSRNNSNIFLCDSIATKINFKKLIPNNFNDISIDSLSYYDVSDFSIIINQLNVIKVPFEFFNMFNKENHEYSKIFLSSAYKFKLKDKTGLIIMFKTENVFGEDFNLETEGVVLGWSYNNEVLCNFEYFDNVFEGDPYIRLIDNK